MAENKKDSFTFSDKIKNSKPAVNPFAKKGASKIGNNGKPKQTLFERTRRDAPFVVAAAAALLMLPFLYKYSGNVNDDVIVPPGSEDSIFDPERFGFSPSNEDPTGQIAQLAGRDPLSLIKGWGNPEEEEPAESDYESRDAFDQDYTPSPRPDTPNYRQTAPAATRAAFQRTPTKIKDLGSASLNLRGGGGVGSRFGGAQLKAAAKQSSASAPKRGAQARSLTPLRSAANPSRSYFGQGGAAQARASRDALSKANAAEALRDAMFAPVKNERVGGLGDGFFASGGGPGKIDRNMDFKGIEPWWWDMMKQQEMEKWKWNYFLWRKGLVEPLIAALAEVLATFGKGLACCILTGEDDCSMGSMWGTDGTTAEVENCKCDGNKFYDVRGLYQHLNNGANPPEGSSFKLEDLCKGTGQAKKCKYNKAKGGGGNLGFVGKRINCLGGTYHGRGATDLQDRFNCEAIDSTHNFELQASGKANKATWHYYHAVIARNYVPFQTTTGEYGGEGYYLCGAPRNDYNPKDAAGYSNIESGKAPGVDQTARAADKKSRVTTWESTVKKDEGGKNKEFDERFLGMNRETVNDSCVIYVAEGKVFDWDNFKSKTIKLLNDLKLTYPTDAVDGSYKKDEHVDGEVAFNSLGLYFIEGYAMKTTLSKGFSDRVESSQLDKHGKYKKVRVYGMPVGVLPVKYVDFETLYVLRRNSSKDTEKFTDKKIDTRSYGRLQDGEDYQDGMTRTTLTGDKGVTALRTGCRFNGFRITAREIYEGTIGGVSRLIVSSDLNFAAKYGKNAEGLDVTLTLKGSDGKVIIEDYLIKEGEKKCKDGDCFVMLEDQASLNELDRYFAGMKEGEERSFIAYWTATDPKTGETSKDQKPYSTGKPRTPPTFPCQDGTYNSVEVDKNGCTVGYKCVGGQWSEQKEIINCPEGGPTVSCREGEVKRETVPGFDNCEAKMICDKDGKWSNLTIEGECSKQDDGSGRRKARGNDGKCEPGETAQFNVPEFEDCHGFMTCKEDGTWGGATLEGTCYEVSPQADKYRNTSKLIHLSRDISKIADTLNNHATSEKGDYHEVTGPFLFANTTWHKSVLTPSGYNTEEGKKTDIKRLNASAVQIPTVGGECRAAIDFMDRLANTLNGTMDTRDVKRGYVLQWEPGSTPMLPEFVDAMNLAQTEPNLRAEFNGEIERAAVCSFMRGVMKASYDPAYPKTDNTFGAAAIYLGMDAGLFPRAQATQPKDENEVSMVLTKDPQFLDIPYTGSDYIIGNHVANVSNTGISVSAGKYVRDSGITCGVAKLGRDYEHCTQTRNEIRQAKVNGRYPLAAMIKDAYTPIVGEKDGTFAMSANEARGHYDQLNDLLFANEGKCCELEGKMPIQDALDYIQRVIENGLNYKPRASIGDGSGSRGSSNRRDGK